MKKRIVEKPTADDIIKLMLSTRKQPVDETVSASP
jgi:hypothetical protein